MKEKRKAKGLRSAVVFIPTIITISILYALILISTIMIDNDTKEMSKSNEDVTDCIDLITTLQSSSSKLSATAISFAHMPSYPNGKLNENALKPYVDEYSDDGHKPKYILKELKKYGYDNENPKNSNSYFNEQTANLVKDTADAVETLLYIQSHAFYLINDYVNVALPHEFTSLVPQYDLSLEEIELSFDERQDLALELLLNREYSINQELISQNTREATSVITSSALKRNNEISFRIKLMRGFLWGSILLILLANLVLFIILLKKLVFPIIKFSKRIDENKRLDEKHALYEPNYLAKAYNNLIDRHKDFEDKLREVAEIDSLTGLPNRYCYNEFLRKEIINDRSTCVLLLDINNLKYTNDTYGHAKGDELIKNASFCIKECFLDQEGKNCYRIGGDEFVAIIDNINEDEIEKLIQEFNEKQKQYNVSIAIGYSYCNNVKEIGYEKLIMDADKKMYINKELYKKSLKGDSIYC